MAYQLTASDCILRLADNAFIPQDEANTNYAAYLEWLEEGNMPEPAQMVEPSVELTPTEKLARSGLTVAELKELLGLD